MNSNIKVTVTSLDNEGRGIATLDGGKKIFVPYVLPGEECIVEIVKEASRFAEGNAIELTSEAADRVLPFKTLVPGCNVAHLSYDSQLTYKRQKVVSCLTRIGHFDADYTEGLVEQTVASPSINNYRNHMQYRLIDGKFYLTAEGSSAPVDANLCPLEYKIFEKIRSAITAVMDNAPTTLWSGVVLRGSERTREILVEFVSDSLEPHEIIISNSKRYLDECGLARAINDAAENYKINGITLRMSRSAGEKRTRGGKRVVLAGKDYYSEELLGRKFQIKAGAFFQVNIPQAEALYTLAGEGTETASSVCDIYCGTGSIGLSVIRDGQTLLGVESVPEAVASAKINAALSSIDNAKFICKPAEKFSFVGEGLPSPVAAIVDPPRAGMDIGFINHLLKLNPEIISYVSCDPATLARDLKLIVESGKYVISRVCPVDMFPNCSHVETVVLLTPLKKFDD